VKTAYAALLALTLTAGSAGATTLLDGTFNGSYACPKFQGQTNVVLSFVVTGSRVKLIQVIYESNSSRYGFGSSVVEYTGNYNATTRKFSVASFQTVGQEPRGWSYSKTLNGLVSANGAEVTILRDPSSTACSSTSTKRISASSILAK
jgi:hypothetical protein